MIAIGRGVIPQVPDDSEAHAVPEETIDRGAREVMGTVLGSP